MALDVSVRFNRDFAELAVSLNDIGKRALPYATSTALTKSALGARDDYRKALPSIFDRPTPFTLGSAEVHPATVRSLESRVDLKYQADRYLGAEILSGARRLKRSEMAFKIAGFGEGYYVPGKGARLDSYGNVSRSMIVQILSQLQAAEYMSGYTANQTARSRMRNPNRAQYFAVPARNGKSLAVFRRKPHSRVLGQPILVFVKKPPVYRARLPFEAMMRTSFTTRFGPELSQALARTIARFSQPR